MRAVEARWWSSRVQALQAGGVERVVGFAVQGGGGRGAYDAPFINHPLASHPRHLTMLRTRRIKTYPANQTRHTAPMPPRPAAPHALLLPMYRVAAAPAQMDGVDGGEAGEAEGWGWGGGDVGEEGEEFVVDGGGGAGEGVGLGGGEGVSAEGARGRGGRGRGEGEGGGGEGEGEGGVVG